MRFLKRLAPLAVIVAAALLLVFVPDIGPERYKDLSTMFRIESQRQACAGIAVAVVHDGEIVYGEAFGYDGARRKLTIDTPLYLGPSSEILTAALAYTFILDKTISLKDSVGEYLNWIPAGIPGNVTDASGNRVTGRNLVIADLITHTAGASLTAANTADSPDSGFETTELDPENLLSSSGRDRVSRSSLGYRALALSLEKAGRRSFADLLRDRITRPLGMDSTTARRPDFTVIPRGSGLFFGLALPYPAIAVAAPTIPSDGIISSSRDMGRLVAYLAAPSVKGVTYLPSRAVPSLYQPLYPKGNYGYGWRIIEHEGDRTIFQGGTIEGFASNIVIWPERRSGVVILSAQGGVVQSSIVLPMLASTAARIMFDGSASRPFPVGRVFIVLAISSFIYLLVLCIQISGATSWARTVKDRSEARGSFRPVIISGLRTVIGCAVRVLVVVYAPILAGLAFGRAVTIKNLFVLEPGLAAMLVAASAFGIIRNLSRLVWLYSTTNRNVFSAR